MFLNEVDWSRPTDRIWVGLSRVAKIELSIKAIVTDLPSRWHAQRGDVARDKRAGILSKT